MKRRSTIWIAAFAWILYVISFFLPTVDLGTVGQLEPGWKAAATAGVALLWSVRERTSDVMIVALWGLTNALMVLSPVPIVRRWNRKALNWASLVMLAATGINALALLDGRRHHGVGYYFWLCAFGLIALTLVRRRQELESRTA